MTLKRVITVAVLAAAITLTGCSTIQKYLQEWMPEQFGPEQISAKGTQFYIGDEKLEGPAVALDWSVQTHDGKDYDKLVDYFADLGVKLFVSYAGPGLGKGLTTAELQMIVANNPKLTAAQVNAFCPAVTTAGIGMNVPNSKGVPYTDVRNLVRNKAYWDEIDRRVKYAQSKGISLVFSCSFVDVGMLSDKVDQNRLNQDIAKTAKDYKWASGIWSPVSEAEEGGGGAVQRAIFLAAVARDSSKWPSGFHSVRDNGAQAGAIDFISVQFQKGRFSLSKLQALQGSGKPVIVVEDRNPSDQEVRDRLWACHNIGVIYTITSRNFGMSPWLEKEVKKFAEKVN